MITRSRTKTMARRTRSRATGYVFEQRLPRGTECNALRVVRVMKHTGRGAESHRVSEAARQTSRCLPGNAALNKRVVLQERKAAPSPGIPVAQPLPPKSAVAEPPLPDSPASDEGAEGDDVEVHPAMEHDFLNPP